MMFWDDHWRVIGNSKFGQGWLASTTNAGKNWTFELEGKGSGPPKGWSYVS